MLEVWEIEGQGDDYLWLVVLVVVVVVLFVAANPLTNKRVDVAPVAPRSSPPRAVLSCLLARDPPCGRIHGAMAFNERTNDIVMLGGQSAGLLDDELVLSADDHDWTIMRQGSPRAHHCMAYIEAGLVVYGGVVGRRKTYAASSKVEVYDNDVRVLDLDSGEWFVPTVATRDAPRPRAAATLVADSTTSLVLFGGRCLVGDKESFLSDAWRIDFDDHKTVRWTRLAAKQGEYVPPGRHRHAAAVVDSQLLVFGGASDAGPFVPPGALEALDLTADAWSLVSTRGEGPRHAPGMLAHAFGRAVCVVAAADSAGLFNDVFLLACDSAFTWSKVQLDWRSDWTMVPGHRHGHFSCASQDSVFIFGGQSPSGMLAESMLVLRVPFDVSPDRVCSC